MKRELYAELIDALTQELAALSEPAGHAPDPERKKQIEAQLLAFRFLPHREFAPADPVVPTSVVELEQLGERKLTFWVLLVPALGGWVSTYRGKPLQILTASSPLGDALLGQKQGDEFSVETYRSEKRRYRILTHF